ncbi:uncharacterized protein LOC127808599 [Diospyros lotus]|uniref:uncharacterized protein LOC127808599 n=1 Tax=Diospyros lotus TaxID=55363 RepID=UPI002259465F|nr:uncharacterized protein LOC127808599 [Diospyros lotus]
MNDNVRQTESDPIPVGNPYFTHPWNRNSIDKSQSPMQGDRTLVSEWDVGISKAENDNKKDVVKEVLLPQEFPKIQEPKEGSKLWENDSLPTLDFGLKKKYSDLGSNDKKDDCIIGNNFGGEKHNLKENCNDQVARAADPKGPTDLFEGEAHVEGHSGKHKENGVVELFAWNQEVPIENSVYIKEVGAGTEINLSRVTLDLEEERRWDKEIRVDHILQEQEAEDLVENQSINRIGDGNCCEDGFHAADMPVRDIVPLDNRIINHVWDEGSDEGLVSAIEEPVGLSRHFLCNQYVRTARARKFESLTIAGNGMFGGMSLAEISSNVVKVCGFEKEVWGLVIEGQLQKRIDSSCMVGNEALHKLDHANSQGGLQCFVPIKQNTVSEMQESMASANKFLTRFQPRKRAKEAKSFAVENKAPAALFILATTSCLEFLSPLLKGGLGTGVCAAATPRSDTSTLLHVKVFADIAAKGDEIFKDMRTTANLLCIQRFFKPSPSKLWKRRKKHTRSCGGLAFLGDKKCFKAGELSCS